MNESHPRPPYPQGVFRTPRSETYWSILEMVTELTIARFVISRCMDKLDLVQLLDVFAEVSETLDGRDAPAPPRLITPRDENRS